MAGAWIIADNREQTLELLTIGRELATTMGTKLTALLWQDQELADDYISHGADEILLLPPLPEDQPPGAYIPVIADEAQKKDPDIILMASTVRGKEMAARIATRLNTGLCSNCIALNLGEDGKTVEMERLVFGGTAVQKVTCTVRPAMATIPLKTFEPAVKQEGRQGDIRELPAPAPSPVKILERKPRETEAKDISESRIVVCVGRGIEKEEDLALARKLAHALGGEIGCTRPISEENHWLPEELCIGISGISVKPDLYIGLGISGQVQHVTGIRDAKVICAVNTDENAPIFAAADYGIVGNLYDVVPKLIEAFKT
ncbi:MAG: electron transfer flavoprotein subunit alpha/FixB family protein [Deltaproteobacteria bacterium]|nr:electron transfer flavoprotein subunit alpha/FixB family protein [Deltaproteobacteria bacterium]